MKFAKSDLAVLYWPLAFLFAAALLAVAAPLLGGQALIRMEDRSNSAQQRLDEARRQLVRARRGMQAAPREAYLKLAGRGAFGPFKRIDLVEYLESAGASLFDLQFSIYPVRKVALSDFTLDLNRAHLQLSLLHEGRLLGFLDALRAQRNGIPLVAGCSVERLSDNLAFEPHLNAGCTVIWMTLEQRP